MPKIYAYFAKDTQPATMQRWRADTKATLRVERKQRASQGTFEGDAKKYLAAVTAMPTYKTRKEHIDRWVALFGTRRRDTIEAVEIRAQRDRWMLEPRSETDKRPVSAGTINRRLRALSNLWTVLDGLRAPNPVRDVPELQEPGRKKLALTRATIAAVLACVPDRGRRHKGDNPKKKGDPGSLSKARLRVLAETGWPAGVLMRMTAAAIHWTAHVAELPPRHKGAGAAGDVVPLTEEAIVALKELDRLKGWGKFSTSSLAKTWHRACHTAKAGRSKVYALRHSFLTELAIASRDERAVQHAGQHADIRTTRGYTEGSVDPRVRAAFDQLKASRGRQ